MSFIIYEFALKAKFSAIICSMRTLVIYDSAYGNTQKIAKAIAGAIDATASLVKDITPEDIKGVELLVVGSPTQGGQPLAPILSFLRSLPSGSLKGVKCAAFDTRFAKDDHGLFLKIVTNVFGYAADKIDSLLNAKGGQLITGGEGFIVTAKTGPLGPGEIDRAKKWAKEIVQAP